MTELWRDTWRRGFAPLLPTEGLKRLRERLVGDDPRLLQGDTIYPPTPFDWSVEKACPVATCFDGNVGEVYQRFARTCAEADNLLGEMGGCRFFLLWVDDTQRDVMAPLLLEEVDRELKRRGE